MKQRTSSEKRSAAAAMKKRIADGSLKVCWVTTPKRTPVGQPLPNAHIISGGLPTLGRKK